MGDAVIPIPDKATIDALIHAFAVESAGAMDWTVERSKDASTSAPVLTVSTLREMPSAKNADEAEVYRLIDQFSLTCWTLININLYMRRRFYGGLEDEKSRSCHRKIHERPFSGSEDGLAESGRE